MAFQDRPHIRLINAIGGGLRRLGLKIRELDPDRVEAAARRRTGLSDFGAARYRDALESLCTSYTNDPRLTFLGRTVSFEMLVHVLDNRARVQRDLRDHPEILREKVRRPLFVLGLPRTGTTLMYNLLAEDPASRPLLHWEAMQPSPPPEPETYARDPRIGVARRRVRRMNAALPEMSAIHPVRPDVPEECTLLLMNAFITPFFCGQIDEFRYRLAEVPDSEIEAAYSEYRAQLQLLQWKVKQDHWVLKSPSHAFGLGGLLKNFPDAAVVYMHRDLTKTVPSLCSLFAVLEEPWYQTTDRPALGQRIVEQVHLVLNRGLKGRDSVPGARVMDVAYADLVREPRATVERIYDRFGYTFSSEFDRRLQKYLAEDTHPKTRKHSYSLEEYGLSPDRLQQEFGDYIARFEIPPE